MATSLRLDVPKFDGRGGPTVARQFITQLKAVKAANEITDEKMLSVTISLLAPKSPAWMWYQSADSLHTDHVDTWENFLKNLSLQFQKSWTFEQQYKEEDKLVKESSESSQEFFYRCQFFHINMDCNLPADHKTEAGYKKQLDFRIRNSYLRGLPKTIVSRLTSMDTVTATSEQVFDLVQRLLVTDFGVRDSVQTVDTDYQDVSAFSHSRGKPSKPQGGGGGGGARGGSYDPSRDPSRLMPCNPTLPRPSKEELALRDPMTCGRCKLNARHRTGECIVKMDIQTGKPFPSKRKVKNH